MNLVTSFLFPSLTWKLTSRNIKDINCQNEMITVSWITNEVSKVFIRLQQEGKEINGATATVDHIGEMWPPISPTGKQVGLDEHITITIMPSFLAFQFHYKQQWSCKWTRNHHHHPIWYWVGWFLHHWKCHMEKFDHVEVLGTVWSLT